VISRPVNGITGSAGIVVEVVVDAAVVVDELGVDVVDAGSVVGTVDAVVTAVTSVESLLPPLLHAVTTSAAIMKIVVVLVYFTVLSAVQSALRAGVCNDHV
jgi:hypothetical protein